MALDGHIGSLSTRRVQVAVTGHPAVFLRGALKSGQGILEPGTILTRDSGELLAWDGTGDPVGVLPDQVDSATESFADYIVHGTVDLALLKMADGSAPTDAQIFLLHQISIWGL